MIANGAREACEFREKIDFKPSSIAFGAPFDRLRRCELEPRRLARRIAAMNTLLRSSCNISCPA